MLTKPKEQTYLSPLQITWKRFKKNKLSVAALIFIVFISLAGVFAYWIIPDNTPNANRIILQISTSKPGATYTFLKIASEPEIENRNIFSILIGGKKDRFSYLQISDYKIINDLLFASEYTGIEGDTISKVGFSFIQLDPHLYSKKGENLFSISGKKNRLTKQEFAEMISKDHVVSKTFWLGTDRYGRDMWSRLLLGARVSLSIGLMAVFISMIIGVTLGALAGYYRGWVDISISWLINVIWSLPALLLVIAVSFALGKGFWQVFVAVGLSMWVEVARIVRGQLLSLREVEFVEAGRALGYSSSRIIFKHILPNISGPILVAAASNFVSAILLEAGLSFLGFGVQPPFPSWGGMIKEHYGYILIDAAYLAIIPGLAIMLLVYSFNLVAIGLRDAFDLKEGNTFS